ncbi:hypothetical protein [Leucobacter triazinivorans]|uniref:Amine oxidase domain-containing protein n=1 Tax=Leucobacter triazinivorans TaxID=1784719 RepID=A0A4P6KFR8_9MICO|nr:hypothetical protein [Leucobacter triazinivorans]QBE48798.1 hypothetical protein EVS81_08105 [Leucobacter triazinivorans]
MGDAYVLGDGLPELAAALDLAEVGLSVRVAVPPRGECGDSWDELDDRGEFDPDGSLRGLLEHISAPLDEGDAPLDAARPAATPPGAVLLRDAAGGWAPQPEPAVLGIPAVPLSSRAFALLGTGGALRAYLDRVRPVLTIGKTHALGALVQSRLGGATLERLVQPIVRERFGVSADEVDVAIAAPGLNEALTVAGSLSGAALAYAERDVARETRVAPRGGWLALRDALLERLTLYGVSFGEASAADVRRGESEADEWVVAEGDAEFRARALVVGARAIRDSSGAPGELEALDGLLPRHLRIGAVVGIEDPGLPDAPDGLPALQTVTLAGGERWSVRVEPGGGAPLARVAGPAIPADRAPGAAEARSRILEALEASSLSPRGSDTPHAAASAAPHATVGQRDEAADRLEGFRESAPDLLPVGAALHGGAVASALADARTAAVLLRRRLTGISG